MQINIIVLAAGKVTRMRSQRAKVLHTIGGIPMISHVLDAALSLQPASVGVVLGHQADAIEVQTNKIDPRIQRIDQFEQKGTGHAVQVAVDALPASAVTLVVYGDVPLIQPQTLEAAIASATKGRVGLVTAVFADPAQLGRIVRDDEGAIQRIVEFKDATDIERAITLCNSGVICCAAPLLFELLNKVTNDNASGEYYLTDVIGLARTAGHTATVVTCSEAETLGINSRAELAAADALFQAAARLALLDDGVTLVAPDTVYLSLDTLIGRDTIIEPNVVFGPDVTVESGATIRAFSHLEGCHVSRGSIVGPYARLRPGAELSENVRVGNFVEIKNATIAEGAKVNHLSYIGDASIGERSNIGAGTITCNYDGVMKHHTEIGADVFIGSNTMLVAPVTIGNRAMTGSGSVITSDVGPEALALSRAPQIEKPGMAQKLFDMLQVKKARMSRSS